jgi:glycine oxidase
MLVTSMAGPQSSQAQPPGPGDVVAGGTDVAIAGGGVIGTAIAWRAALRGLSVTVVDPGWGDAATEVAAGMLGPVSESMFGEQDLLALNLLAVGRFPSFAAELEQATGLVTGLRTEGTLAVAFDRADHDRLARLTAFRHELAAGPCV